MKYYTVLFNIFKILNFKHFYVFYSFQLWKKTLLPCHTLKEIQWDIVTQHLESFDLINLYCNKQ